MRTLESVRASKEFRSSAPVEHLVSEQAVGRYMAGAFVDHPTKEQFWVILLDARLLPTTATRLSVGKLDNVAKRVRQIVRLAQRNRAHAFTIVHYRPNGDRKPTGQYMSVSVAANAAAKQAGLLLFDHVIIATDGCGDDVYSSWSAGWE